MEITTGKGLEMTTKTLQTKIRIGVTSYSIGTKVQSSDVIDSGTWDERIWVVFPGGEGTFLKPDLVK